jgi:N-acetyl-anhydromuramyl-L-alanine amidase AmpD
MSNLFQRIVYKLVGSYLKTTEYVVQKCKKTIIVLHFTAGYGDAISVGKYFNFLAGKVATAYSAGRDGVIAELFPPAYWAYHLGSSLFNEMRSIGIEIVNIGPLWNKNGVLYDCYGNIYRGEYQTLKVPYKGVFYWATFTEEQYENVGKWAAERCIAFGIIPMLNKGLDYIENNEKLMGITTHVHFRKDKYDIGPAWDWVKFEKYFNAELERLRAGK